MFKLNTVAKALSAVAVSMVAVSAAHAVTVSNLSPFAMVDNSPSFLDPYAPGISTFDQYYAFQVGLPSANFSSTVNYNPSGSVTGFQGALYTASNCSGGTCDLGSLVANYTSSSATELSLVWANVTAGYYVIRLQGNSNNVATGVSGQAALVPVPSVLSLLGVGLLGLGFVGSRRRAA